MASDTKLNTSAKLLFPEPFRPTRNRGLSNESDAEGKLLNRLITTSFIQIALIVACLL